MISSARIRRAQEAMEAARPFAKKMLEMVDDLKQDILAMLHFECIQRLKYLLPWGENRQKNNLLKYSKEMLRKKHHLLRLYHLLLYAVF